MAAADVAAVRRRIEAACARVGRDGASVTLIGATKYATDDQVLAVAEAGVVDLGENRPQALRTRAALVPAARWHAIGPLQRNKAGIVAELAVAFHALDRVEVAEALSARRPAGASPLAVYVEVNAAGESTKAGVAPADAAALVEAAQRLPGLRVVGLMTMPPLATEPEDSRPWFAELRSLAASLDLSDLSMGTTEDFEVAIEEGATAVRVGRAIFGERS